MTDRGLSVPVPKDRDRLLRLGTGAFALIVVLLVAGIGWRLFVDSRLSIAKFGLGFWKGRDWDPVSGEFGAFPFLWGTVYSSALALAISTPVALGIAIFLSDLCPRRLREPLTVIVELLAAVPSVVYGLWGMFVLVPIVRSLQAHAPDWMRALPFFSGPPLGVGMLAAALILALMVVPFTSSVAREILKAVPREQREAAYALGATRWEAIRVALHYGRTGLVGAVVLGLGRALGETMAVTMVIGNSPQASVSLFAPQYTMAAVLANEFTEAAGDLYLSALTEVGLVLFAVTLIANVASRLMIWSISRSRSAAPRVTLAKAA